MEGRARVLVVVVMVEAGGGGGRRKLVHCSYLMTFWRCGRVLGYYNSGKEIDTFCKLDDKEMGRQIKGYI